MNGQASERITTFQLKLPDSINRLVLSDAALNSKNKHQWIEEAIKEKLEREKEE